jgi:hypothetical protein
MKISPWSCLCWIALGCSGSTLQIGPDGGSSAAGQAGNGTGDGVSVGTAGAGGSGAGAGGAGAGGGSNDGACLRTNDRVGFRVTKGEVVLDCTTVAARSDAGATTVVQGLVTDTTASWFTVDSCPPGADCPPMLTKFDLVGGPTNIDSLVVKGDFVRVEYAISLFFACQQSLEVTALGSWGGMSNPTWPEGMLLYAIADGGGPFPDSPYTVDRVLLGCDVDAGRGCGAIEPGDYAFSFVPSGAPDRAIRVDMGETRLTEIQLGRDIGVVARNLRSYQTWACDDYWNFAYVLNAAPLPL